MASYKNFVREVLQSNHYSQVDKTELDVLEVIHKYGLTPRQDSYVVPNEEAGEGRTLLNLTGTIPIKRNAGKKFEQLEEVSVVIWLMETYPLSAPVVFVEPRAHNGIIKIGRYVNEFGEVALPYLNRWTAAEPGFNLCALIQCLTVAFYTELPVRFDTSVKSKDVISELTLSSPKPTIPVPVVRSTSTATEYILPTPKPTTPVPFVRSTETEVDVTIQMPKPNVAAPSPDVVPFPVQPEQARPERIVLAKKVIPIQGRYSLGQFVDDLLKPGLTNWDFKLDENHRNWYVEYFHRTQPVGVTAPRVPEQITTANASTASLSTGEGPSTNTMSKPLTTESSATGSKPAMAISFAEFVQREEPAVKKTARAPEQRMTTAKATTATLTTGVGPRTSSKSLKIESGSGSQPAVSISIDFQQRHQRRVTSRGGSVNGTHKEGNKNKGVMTTSEVPTQIEEQQKMRVIDRMKVPGVHAEIKRLQQAQPKPGTRQSRRDLRKRSPSSGMAALMKK
ncbi:hypothetical protein Ocin01_14272 [Orchesella cincta]|uniref:UEV domain-containing protein n=1 Tax=Orchesella cincta TaxID=48709 RepID=A0A1D2MHL2_ORCCI|nr:hypothetical protein Ocin01_14272 [Orchesella cincta]